MYDSFYPLPACAEMLSLQEVDLYRDLWEEVMYNIVRVANLVGQLSASCQQYGLGNEVVPLPQNLVSIMTELEMYGCITYLKLAPLFILLFCSELGRVVRIMSQCRGKTRCERLKMGLARNDMIKQIQKCDRQMSRMFERFVVYFISFDPHKDPHKILLSGCYVVRHSIPARCSGSSVDIDDRAYSH